MFTSNLLLWGFLLSGKTLFHCCRLIVCGNNRLHLSFLGDGDQTLRQWQSPHPTCCSTHHYYPIHIDPSKSQTMNRIFIAYIITIKWKKIIKHLAVKSSSAKTVNPKMKSREFVYVFVYQ